MSPYSKKRPVTTGSELCQHLAMTQAYLSIVYLIVPPNGFMPMQFNPQNGLIPVEPGNIFCIKSLLFSVQHLVKFGPNKGWKGLSFPSNSPFVIMSLFPPSPSLTLLFFGHFPYFLIMTAKSQALHALKKERFLFPVQIV